MSPSTRIARRSSRRRLRMRVTTSRGSSFTVNVGIGGFCTELMRVLPVGERLEGLLHLSGGDTRFAGRVAWARAGDSRLNLRGRMGVCFVRIGPELARGLAACEGQAAGAPA